MQPFGRLGIEFKGPIFSTSHNRYILTITDEHSCFLFMFACSDTRFSTVPGRLIRLFTIFDMLPYMHFDRGTSSMSTELSDYRKYNGVTLSHTTSYSPQGIGQVGCLNSILWGGYLSSPQSQRSSLSQWKTVLSKTLESIRSLLCTVTSCTPHETLFKFPRSSTTDTPVPTWITALKQMDRSSKFA